VHSPVSTGVSFAILAAVVGLSFAYISSNPVRLPHEIGVSVIRVTPEIAQVLRLQEAKGLLVADVARGSPADKAGLHAVKVVTRNGQQVPESWDVIVAMNGVPINNEDDVQKVLAGKAAGQNITFTIIRNNVTLNLNLILE
jgi:S1-C subfamily serine protease